MEPASSSQAPAGLEAPSGTERRCIRDVGCQTDDRFLGADEPGWELPESKAEEPARKKIKRLKKPPDPYPLLLSPPKSGAHSAAQMALAMALTASAGAYALKSIEKKEQQDRRSLMMGYDRTRPSAIPMPLSLPSLTGVTALEHPTSESMAMAEATRSLEILPSGGVSMVDPKSGRLVETPSVSMDLLAESGRSSEAVATVPTSRSNSEEKQEQRWIVDSIASDVPPPPTTTRPLPPRCSPFREGASMKKIREWNMQCRETSKRAAKDPRYNLPFLKQDKDTAHAVTSTIDRTVVHKVASSVVSISSIGQDGMVRQFTGIILGDFSENDRVSILTSSATVCYYDGNLLNCKLLICLSNKDELEGNLLFYDPFYKIAVLDISAGIPLAGLSFASSPEEGDEVFVLATNRMSSLKANKGTVSGLEEPYSGCNFFMYLTCELPECGIGGPVVGKDGGLSGIALKLAARSSNAILSSPIILKCIEMQRKFRRTARPIHGLSLRTVKSLGVTAKDCIISDHKIDTGYIVEKVLINSTAEEYDVRLGDVIVSFDGMHSHSLVELELYLLSLGWQFLERNLDMESKVVLKLQVCDPLGDCERSIRLPVGFTCFSPTALPNVKTILDVHLRHVIDHYDIAILSVSPDFPLELPSIGHGPEYGQEVFVLARDRESSLMARRGEIRWLEESDYLRRNYYMFLTCTLPTGGNGGQIIDHVGNTRGMSFYMDPYPAVLSISTIVTCVKMYMQFNRVARPMLDLGLRTIAFMDVEKQEVMSHKYGISHGLIVDMVPYDSEADKFGIRRGNVIISLGDRYILTLPELEDYLFSLGWECLEGNKSASMLELPVRFVISKKIRREASYCLSRLVDT